MDSNFNDGFQLLTCDEDVLLFGKDTFTVGKFRGFVLEITKAKIYSNYNSKERFTILNQINTRVIIGGKISFKLSDSQWKFCTKEVKCQLLGVGYSGWKKGKLKIQTDIDLCPQNYDYTTSNCPLIDRTIIKIDLKFCPEPNEYQSPLDKLQ
ncbi:KGK domain-containing protein [Limnoraphis robusta]|uniref:KGK domain-containing protein n=1 Tax=Limnoraphis robusta CCNP1315 TaxID=3110306 RepID=A0ABU5U5C6_9CYAN|nr:KGK domain-containing protein [Limnoraphis robusta]MEA5522126.1 KGK domain-containing protein [Limnoraphis robusta CCNP1315]MEA5544170.1 KGK domain-containing protein [Limnoraphis robusta CCNP1324]